MANKDSKPTFVGEKFGQKRPPLSITIKQILERYPDGQIFKEMIQNADDAEAKRVQFFVDSRSFGKESLAHPGLAPFQGPALLAVNDATFSKKDWEGIEKLQQSIKADDPFKVGRFGIGFNSVYHLTDVPVIISGEKVAYMEPQERIWPDQSGRSFTISELQNTDSLIPFHDISDFKSSGMAKYPKTIFRFPLRIEPSELSEGCYDVQKVHKLINALRAEAKLLLVFLRSVNAIEVYDIAKDGSQTPCFKTEISDKYKSSIGRKRKRLIDKLRELHSQKPYNISTTIGFVAEFTIKVSGVNLEESQRGEFRLLVSNQVGSEDKSVLEAAEKQKVFPWVGTAIELNEDSRNGRIFCFLPMPIEASSNLPVHVNGTFGMTDDRRSLKWPGVERENDSTADWNQMLVKCVLPKCYVTLLLEAKKYLSADQFYKVWPCQASLRKGTWGKLLEPLYTSLLVCPVFWSKVPKKEGEWIEAKHGCFVKRGTTLDTVIQQSLVSCGVNVVCIPQNIWEALQLAKVDVRQIGPKFVRTKLKDNHRYITLEKNEKYVILEYCMSDNQYFDLIDLFLLPLSSGKFAKFQKDSKGVSKVYVSSADCPSYLLPNLPNSLVNISVENLSLHEKLLKLANSNKTHVKPLTESTVAELLEQSMPTSWKGAELVSLPHPEFPIDWFSNFWKWAGGIKLKTFAGKHVLPVAPPLDQSTAEFCVVKMTSSQAVIYVPSGLDCSKEFQKSLDKLNIFVCRQDDFPFVFHKHLKTFVKPYDTNGLLDAIAATANYSQVQLTDAEAETLRNFIKPSDLNSQKRADIASKLRMFKTAENTQGSLYSIDQVRINSTLKKPIAAPTKSCLEFSRLPSSMLMFSQFDPSQVQLLQKLKVTFPSDCEFILNHLIPMMRTKSVPDALVDEFMTHILDAYHALVHEDNTIIGELRTLAFVRTSTSAGNRKPPSELFDPRDHDIYFIFQKEEGRFPISPYNCEKYLDVMKEFGLRTVISSDEILGVIKSIGGPPSPKPQRVDHTRLTCATAILHYVCKSEFLTQLHDVQQFFTELKYLSETKSWIPVLATPPSANYPSNHLKWKGSGFDSHLMSLQDKPCFVLSTEDCEEVPLLVGSQMYLTYPSISPKVAERLQQSTSALSQYIVPHLEELIACSDELTVKTVLHLLHPIYRKLENTCLNELEHLGSLAEWLYIRESKRFVSPTVVAMRKNSDFRHDLEPYIYLLPETLQEYKQLFCNFGMHEEISQDQILSVLEKMRNEISLEKLSIASSEASRLIMSILNWLTDNGIRDISDLVQNSNVYIPTDVESDWPQLENARQVIYSDSDFLKEYASSESETTLVFSHSSIHQKMAECLGLKLLSEELDISEDAFEDSGQHQDLTERLNTILKDYKDGLTIAKELLQNADDAEATEFNICYDSRQHSVRKERLFFQGMLQSHGPALIFHNNKTFSDDDFVNITKLAGATKEKKQLKIGKFGVGFCSVYHITDVPSFVSRDQLHILDPTLTCLAREVKNPNKPGKKVKFTMKMISRSDQLQPYVGLFGFDKTKSYDGTLFRLPFRFQSSDLSGNFYDESKVDTLISELRSCASKLLLFLQHVNRITFQRIDSNQLEPTVLFEIRKCQLSIPASLPPSVKCYSISLLEESTKASENWLVAHSKTTLRHCNTTNHATSSVACPLSFSSSTYKVMPLEGEMFCFLPLSQKTGLPVHVSANFAVISNRRGIWTSDEVKDKADSEVVWNQNIMRYVVPKTYCNLLLALQEMWSKELLVNYIFHGLWPLPSMLKIKRPWEELLPSLYDLIADNELFLTTTNQWVNLALCKVLDAGILKQASDYGTPKCVMDVLTHLKQPLVQLPAMYHNHFQLNDSLITEKAFIKLFFKYLTAFSKIWRSRNEVIQCILEIYATEYDDATERSYFLDKLLNSHACIPTTPNGTKLRKCNELIDPDSEFAELYDKDEGRFPDEPIASRKSCQSALKILGMLCDDISWEMIIDRARSISSSFDKNKLVALRRVRLILKCIDSKKDAKFRLSDLHSCDFLPVAPKPDSYPSALTWRGKGVKFSSGNKLTLSGRIDKHSDGHAALAGSQNLFLCENSPENGGCGNVNHNLCQLLQIKPYPTVSEVICQLKHLVHFSADIEAVAIDKTCNQIYLFLNKEIRYAYEHNKKLPDLAEVRKIPCIWTGTHFVTTACVAVNWKVNGPYLYAVPSNLLSQHDLCRELHIQHDFSESEIASTLQKMSMKFGNTPIDSDHEALFREMIPLLHKIKPKKFSNFKILLPDERMVLRWSTELAYNDAEWAPNDGKSIYVNDIISSKLAKQLHIKAISSEVLEKFTVKEKSYFAGTEFGQREDLTQRIQNILRDYPFNNTVLKELLQNADDAKASKMFVILDKRFHNTKKVLSENWVKLQGPALLVWNDSTFSDSDLKGIQKLGLGSKRRDHESIGQYGIGFNVVYHLTDCPSFVTDNNTLCVLDPHCHFVPGATPKSPGRMFSGGEFWQTYPDIKPAYLHDLTRSSLSEISGGSLFRFPLRYTDELVSMSEIIQKEDITDPIITADVMYDHLSSWAPQLKNAMFFLNHITELKFYVIKEDSSVSIMHHYKTHVDSASQKHRETLAKKVSQFSNTTHGNEGYLIHYPLYLEDLSPYKKVEEKWIIQQGVGDINSKNHEWQFVKQVKPKHGIALPLSGERNEFKGQLFCFLPLPIVTNLPVHINGNFILNSTRLNLWSTPKQDDKTRWNDSLIKAIGSSYEHFLVNLKQYFFTQQAYEVWPRLLHAIHDYYSCFPGTSSASMDTKWQALSNDIYAKLVNQNDAVLVVVESNRVNQIPEHSSSLAKNLFRLQWHRVTTGISSAQVFFWKSREGCREHDQKTIRPILERIGMKISSAPLSLMTHLNQQLGASDRQTALTSTSPSTVYLYYTQHCAQCSNTRKFPCAINETAFVSVADFKEFTQYTLSESLNYWNTQFAFSQPPYNYPLLLTQDRKLRCFEESNKVLKSKFAETFPQCQHLFLHHQLLDISYDPSYFADTTSGLKVILEIFKRSFPVALFSERKYNNEAQSITMEKLKMTWECLANDPMFSNHISDVIKSCAIIPAKNNWLYKSVDKCLQPMLLGPNSHEDTIRTVEVLQSIGMPFVDTGVVQNVEINCPELSQSSKVLQNLYYLFQENDFTALMNETRVKVLVDLIREVTMSNSTNKKHAMSLPLFQTVDNKFVSIDEKTVYLWPSDSSMCNIAYRKWAHNSNAVFLSKPSGTWLYYPTQFEIHTLSAEELYTKFVFPHFSVFTSEERHSHLKHIRDRLFRDNKHYMETRIGMFNTAPKYRSAIKFITGLKDLKCLEKDDGTLARVSEFCDHKQVIFKTFSKKFQFLPQAYRTDDDGDNTMWMDFFKYLGLRETVTKEEYISFCLDISRGEHKTLSEASITLVKHLLSEAASKETWYDDTTFLSKVSNIAFVLVEKVESLNWVARQAPPTATFVHGNSSKFELASPSQSAILDCSSLLWTVKPLVNLYLPLYPTVQSRALLRGLNVTENATVNTSDIITNITNISRLSSLADFSLFDTYPECLKPPDDVKGLMEIMLDIFQRLSNVHAQSTEIDSLSSLACVPVYSMPQITTRWQLVLVKPCYVLTCDVDKFHPYLHKLPDELMDVLSLLMKMGVKMAIDLTHVQVVLKTAYDEADDEKLEANTNVCVIHSLKCLKDLLYDSKKVKSTEKSDEEALAPLYLPGVDGKLHLSTKLMYGDTSDYRGHMKLDLQETGYAQLLIRTSDYNFTASDLCNVIPENIRPKKMSELCDQKIVSSQEEVSDTHVTQKIKQTLKVNLLSRAALRIIAYHTKDDSIEEKMRPIIDGFVSNIRVLTVRNLKMTIALKETGKVIGNVSTDYHLQCEEHHYCRLYLDSKIDVPSDDHVIYKIADHILSQVAREHPKTAPEILREIRKNLVFLFKVQNDTQIEKMLHKEGIVIESDDMNFPTPELGKEIPSCWHHRLDQDSSNIFYPMEWVGYEDHENHFIFVQVCYPKLPSEHSDWDSVPRLEMKYVIHVNRDDLDGVEVSGLDLYKFIKGKLKSKMDPSQPTEDLSLAVEVYEGTGGSTKREYDAEHLKALKDKIRQELIDIMKLPDEQKKKAVKRLYLKWHPDKNPDNPEFAEEVFKFIQSELERLESGKSNCSGQSRKSWFYDFSSWDETARDHSYFFKREHRSYSSKSSDHFSSPGGSFFYDSYSTNEQRNIKEGWRWVHQAEVDAGVMRMNNAKTQEDPGLNGYGLVCFLSHQVSEKALQGGVYAVCGKYERAVTDHSLTRRAYMIQARKLGQTLGLLSHVSPLERYYLDTRYPNRHPSNIPANHFTAQQANDAVENAEFVLDMVKSFMPDPV